MAKVSEPNSSWLKQAFFGLIAAPAFILVLALCAMNAHDIDFMWFPLAPLLQIPLFLPLLIIFVLGFLVGWLLSRLEN